MKVQTNIISPTVARELLSRGITEQRRLRTSWINYLAEQMRTGNWHPTGDAICLRQGDGALMNAYHRLHAIIKANVSIEMIVASDVTPEAFRVMDRGAVRSMADVTSLPNELVADIMQIATVIQLGSATRLSEEKVLDIAEWWKPAHQMTKSGGNVKGIRNAPVRIAFGLRWATLPDAVSRNYIHSQWRALITSDAPAMSKAVATMWKHLVQQGKSRSNEKSARLNLLLTTYYTIDPSRSDVHPLPRDLDAIQNEVRTWLMQMEDAYLAPPSSSEHPYLFACWNKGLQPARRRIAPAPTPTALSPTP